VTEYPIEVVGIGAEGWAGLSEIIRSIVTDADIVFGSRRQLETVPLAPERLRRWPSPLLPTLRSSIEEFDGRRVCVLASGDPMFHGIGVTLAREFGASRLRVNPAPSSLSLACATLGWAVDTTTTVSAVNAPVAGVSAALSDGAHVVVLSRDQHTPGEVVALLRESGFGGSRVTVLEHLGGHDERSVSATAAEWEHPALNSLNVVAIDCVADPRRPRLTRVPGLPDSAFSGDGQLTKSEVRALTLAALAPAPGELLWDVGGGSGSIAIEWMRTHPSCRATAYESVTHRRAQIEVNAVTLGVPALRIAGAAPASFDAEASATGTPDAVFVGGGLTTAGMVDACFDHVALGGRVVANAVTAESESALLQCVARFGGSLRKFQIYRAEPLGSFTGWRPHLPVAQWVAVKQ
jgi:precorrin-6B C5,15-methyltransferase / cobalt-precorrin-6B C5,C15-methyltransferase